MSQKITEKLGFEPVVLAGPGGNYEVPNNGKSIGPSTNIFFDTQKRKVYVLRLNTLDESKDKPLVPERPDFPHGIDCRP